MKRDVAVISLRQFESAGGLAEGYSFEDFSCPLNEEVQDFLQKKAVHSPRDRRQDGTRTSPILRPLGMMRAWRTENGNSTEEEL